MKKGHRCDPTFVNLKSNTMKNTLQKYGSLRKQANVLTAFYQCLTNI